MGNKILKFSKLLEEDKNNRKINETDNSKDIYNDYEFNTHTFSLAYTTNYNTIMHNNHPSALITLDEEDMSYLKNKYLPKLEDEYQSEINKINKMYNK